MSESNKLSRRDFVGRATVAGAVAPYFVSANAQVGKWGGTCVAMDVVSDAFEMMPTTDRLREMIMARDDAGRIRHEALREGMTALRTDGWRKVIDGTTTPEEVLRLTKDVQGGPAADAV